MQIWPKLYLCICVVVFVYLRVRHSGTLFLRSSYHYLFKNIAHVRSICNFDRSCICVFVYLYLCICTSDTWEHCFWGPYIITFQKIYGLYGPKPCTMEKSWDVTPVTDWLTHTHVKVEQYSAEAESAITIPRKEIIKYQYFGSEMFRIVCFLWVNF